MKMKKMTVKNILVKGCIPAVLVLGLLFGLSYKPKAHAEMSPRAKKATGIIVGAALMGATAGAAGGAKWVPLGLFGGGLTGGLIARSSVKDDYESLERKKEKLENKIQNTQSTKAKEKLTKQLDRVNQKLQRKQ